MGQTKLTAIVQSRSLTLFGHIARMDNNAEANRILSTLPSRGLEETTRKPWYNNNNNPRTIFIVLSS